MVTYLVCLHVSVQIGLCAKTLPTDTTGEWPVLAVRAHMIVEVIVVCEALAALWTAVLIFLQLMNVGLSIVNKYVVQ